MSQPTHVMVAVADLRAAIEELDENNHALRDCNTIAGKDVWPDPDDRAQYERTEALIARLDATLQPSAPAMETQENRHAPGHEKRQREVTICGNTFWADPELIPLLTALNEAGLVTRSHCCGHGDNPAWMAIRMDTIEQVEVRNHGPYKELLLTWRPPRLRVTRED